MPPPSDTLYGVFLGTQNSIACPHLPRFSTIFSERQRMPYKQKVRSVLGFADFCELS
jgi:hypothetical protein